MSRTHSNHLRAFVGLTALLASLSSPSIHADELTIYSAGPGALVDALVEEFEATSKTDVRVFQSSTGQVMARLEAERSRPNADVVISASWGSAKALEEQGDLLEYTPPGEEKVPAELKTGHFIAQGAAALALVWNRDSGAKKPRDWKDLSAPEYRDQVTMPDPAQSGASFALVSALIDELGEEQAWSLLESLSDNGMLVPGPNARALNPVLQGAKSVVFGAVDYIALSQKADGERLEVVFPESGTVIAPRPMMILRTTDQPNEAKAFVDFVMSPEGQSHVADHYLIPARTDVQAKRPGLDSLKQLGAGKPANNLSRKTIIDRFREVTER